MLSRLRSSHLNEQLVVLVHEIIASLSPLRSICFMSSHLMQTNAHTIDLVQNRYQLMSVSARVKGKG